MLDNVLGQLRHVGQVETTLTRQGLAFPRPAGQYMGQNRRGKKGKTQHPGKGVIDLVSGAEPGAVELLTQYREGGQRRKQARDPTGSNHAAVGDADHQQHANPADHATAGVHQQHDEDNIPQHVAGELEQKSGLVYPQRIHGEQAEGQIEQGGVVKEGGSDTAKRGRQVPKVKQNQQQGGNKESIKIEKAQRTPVLFRAMP